MQKVIIPFQAIWRSTASRVTTPLPIYPTESVPLLRSKSTLSSFEQYAHHHHIAKASFSSSISSAIFPNEPAQPVVNGIIPGPKSKDIMKELDKFQDTRAIHFVADYEGSIGNFVKDADGNFLLDLFGQISSLPVGYNHPHIRKAVTASHNIAAMIHRPSIGNLPPTDLAGRIQNTLLKVAPKGLDQVTLMSCGSCSVENAYKVACLQYQQNKRGGQDVPFTDEEITSCMVNKAPGSPNLSIMSFHGAFHGRLFGCLSTTHSKAIHKVNLFYFYLLMCSLSAIAAVFFCI